jgi:hypothetical protein
MAFMAGLQGTRFHPVYVQVFEMPRLFGRERGA